MTYSVHSCLRVFNCILKRVGSLLTVATSSKQPACFRARYDQITNEYISGNRQTQPNYLYLSPRLKRLWRKILKSKPNKANIPACNLPLYSTYSLSVLCSSFLGEVIGVIRKFLDTEKSGHLSFLVGLPKLTLNKESNGHWILSYSFTIRGKFIKI